MWRMSYTIFANLFRLPGILEKMHRMTDRPDLYSDREAYDLVRYVVHLMQKSGFIKTVCCGTENLPKEGGYILYPNHQGKYDAYSIVSAHDEPLTIVMDRERSYFVLVSEILDLLRGKRMDTQSIRQGVRIINEVAEEVKSGRRYIIFPEGAYDDRKHNSLWEFKSGCFKAATKAGAPIVPVALVDSYLAFNSWRILPVRTEVHFLDPILPEEYQGMNTAQIGDIVKERIRQKISERGKS